MAERYYSVVLGEQTPALVTEGSSSTAGEAIEVRVTYDATNLDKQHVLLGLDTIKQYIIQDAWPPNT